MTERELETRERAARRALVLHDHAVLTGLIELTLNHRLFVVRVARSLPEAEPILAD